MPLREMNGAVCASRNCCFNILSDSSRYSWLQEGYTFNFSYMLRVEVSCFIVKWKLKLKSRRGGVTMIPGVSCCHLGLAFQGTEAKCSFLLGCFYPIYKPVLRIGAVYH